MKVDKTEIVKCRNNLENNCLFFELKNGTQIKINAPQEVHDRFFPNWDTTEYYSGVYAQEIYEYLQELDKFYGGIL